MIDRDSSVSTDELHAHADGLLPADRRQAVEAWLASHPDDAALVAEWRAQAEVIRARYAAVASEPPPDRFNLDRLLRTGRGWRAAAVAAALAALIGGGARLWDITRRAPPGRSGGRRAKWLTQLGGRPTGAGCWGPRRALPRRGRTGSRRAAPPTTSSRGGVNGGWLPATSSSAPRGRN